METLVLPALFLLLFADPLQGQSDAERRELAEVRLLVAADRKLPEARERLTALLASLEPRREADPGVDGFATEVAELAAEIARALGLAPAGQAQDKVDQAVLNAVEGGDYSFIQQLGRRAAPGLAQAVRQHPDVLPGGVGHDPLFYLMEADPLAAGRLVEELLALDGFFWKRRLIRAIAEADPLASDEVWTAGEPRRCLADGLVHAVEKYIEDPDVGDQVLRFLDPFQAYGLTPTLRAALVRALRSPSAARRNIAWEEVWTVSSLQSVYEELLSDEDPDLRIRAAEKGFERVRPEVLFEHASDPEVRVRNCIVRRLEESDPASWKAPERAALQRLLVDEKPGIRNNALNLLAKLPTVERYSSFAAEDILDRNARQESRRVQAEPLPDETYRALAAWEDPEARVGFVRNVLPALPAPIVFELCERLARDPAGGLVKALSDRLPPLWWEDPAATLRVAEALLENPARPRYDTLSDLGSVFSRLKHLKSSLAVLVRWAVERGEPDVLKSVDVRDDELKALEPELARDLCVRLFDSDLQRAVRFLAGRFRILSAKQAGAFRSVAADASKPVALRWLALQAAVMREPPDAKWLETARSILADPFWRQADESHGWLREEMGTFVKHLAGDPRNVLVLQMVSDRSLPVSFFWSSIQEFDPYAALAPEIVRGALERWYDSPDGGGVVVSVIQAMASKPALADREALARAARDPRYAGPALATISTLRDPAYLPVLEGVVRESDSFWLISKAVEALSGHLSDEAAELLLVAAAKLPAGELRDSCLAHLEKIREYQDARSRWAARKVQAQTREQVVAELLKLLDSKETEKRVQAIRGLATWEAVETMPRMIQLLSDKNEDVAAAAREALARMNAPKGE